MEHIQTVIDIASTAILVIASLALIGGFGSLLAGHDAERGGGPLLLLGAVFGFLGIMAKFAIPALIDLGESVAADRGASGVPTPATVEDKVSPSLPADPTPHIPPVALVELTDIPGWFWPFLGISTLVVALVPVVIALARRTLGGRRQRSELRQEADRLWDLHVRDLNELKAAYTAFETDPWTAFRRPLLADVTEPLTAEFHQRFAHAQELHTEQRPTSRELVDLFGDAVRAATAAWSAADQHARAVAVPITTDAERRRLRRAEDALRLALDERTSPAERSVALATVEQLIAGLTVMPTKARTTIVAELETKTRLAISGG